MDDSSPDAKLPEPEHEPPFPEWPEDFFVEFVGEWWWLVDEEFEPDDDEDDEFAEDTEA